MFRLTSRGVRRSLALMLPALGACADESPPPLTGPKPAVKANLVAGDVVMVTNASGGTNPGSIRWVVDNIYVDGTIIRFDPSLDGATIPLDSTIVVHASVTIEGPKNKGVTLSGGDRVRVIHLQESATLRNLTITKGYHPTSGGGIYARNGLTLENSTVSFNSAPIGGGIDVHALGLFNSTVARNTSSTAGAGIYYRLLGYNGGSASLYNSTVAQNGPAAGIQYSGGYTASSAAILNNSIIADNGVPARNCVGLYNVTYEGTNISNDATCGGLGQVLNADPKLGLLADRGGPGATIDFAPQSPALNAGIGCVVSVDERYVPRDAKCDVGAFEFTDFTAVTITIDPNATVNAATGSAVVTGTVTCSRAGDQFGVVVDLQEQKGQKLVLGFGGVGVSCTTTAQPWSATVLPETGTFDVGSGVAKARTNDLPNWVTFATTSRSIKLRK